MPAAWLEARHSSHPCLRGSMPAEAVEHLDDWQGVAVIVEVAAAPTRAPDGRSPPEDADPTAAGRGEPQPAHLVEERPLALGRLGERTGPPTILGGTPAVGHFREQDVFLVRRRHEGEVLAQ